VEPQEVDTIIRSLAATMEHQRSINADLRTAIQELRTQQVQQAAFNRQQVEINADIKTTLARIETLLARMIPQGENGRDA
jgi:putative heme iron utilization protein